MSNQPLFELNELTIAFDGIPVVEALNLEVHHGETLALVGESGSGKSVSALGALGLLPANAMLTGERQLDGLNLDGLSQRDWRRIRGGHVGFIFQEPMTSLNPLHNVGKQIGEVLRLHQGLTGQAARRRSHELLERVHLPRVAELLDAWPHQLSGGQRQRVMIAMAIANNPRLLIADEPTTALDVTVQREILALLAELRDEQDMGMLFISHDLNLVRQHADHVCVMHQGRAQETGEVGDVFLAPQSAYTRTLLDAEPSGRPAPVAATTTLLDAAAIGVSFQRPKRLFQRRPTAFEAVQPMDLQIAPGETLGIVGESGSGKSTLAQALLRLIPSRGTLDFDGVRLDQLGGKDLRHQRRRFQVVFQDPFGSLSPRMPVSDIISEGLRFHHPELTTDDVAQRITQTLQEVGLPHDCASRYPHEFSGGQRQRIAIARAIIMAPELVVLDEPTSALDRSVQAQLVSLLRELQRKRGISYLFISHDLSVVRTMAHRIMVLKDGAVVESGGCLDVLEHPATDYTRALVSAAGLAVIPPATASDPAAPDAAWLQYQKDNDRDPKLSD